MIVRQRKYLDEKTRGRLFAGCLAEHTRNAQALETLRGYYAGDAPIRERRRPQGLPNNRVAHGFGRYIVSMAAGYLAGNPVAYQDAGQAAALEQLLGAYRASDVGSLDIELAKNAALYGRGVELIYIDQDAAPRSASLDPRFSFVAYDDSAAHAPLFGMTYHPVLDAGGTPRGYAVSVYTDTEALLYRLESLSGLALTRPIRKPHYFGRVPMVEYWNNDEETGDLSGVTPLIDAYDVLQSGRVNDQEQLVDALLIITGARLEEDEQGRPPAQQLRQDKLLYLPDKDAGAQYLNRPVGSGDGESLRRALEKDIHKFSMVPDLSDEQFAGNVSGVAMKYKLLGLEQLTRVKERWFREALRERMRCYAGFLAFKGMKPLNAETVRMTFTRSLPENLMETAQMVKTLEGLIPQDVLKAQIPFAQEG